MEFVDSICFALWCTIEIQTSATFPPHLLIFRLDFLFPRIKSQLATWKHVWTPRSHTNIIFSFYFLVYRITYLPRNSISTYDSCQTVFFLSAICCLIFVQMFLSTSKSYISLEKVISMMIEQKNHSISLLLGVMHCSDPISICIYEEKCIEFRMTNYAIEVQ